MMLLTWHVLPVVRDAPASMTVPESVALPDGPSPSTSMATPTSELVGAGVSSSSLSSLPLSSVVTLVVTVGGPVVIVIGSSCSEDIKIIVGAFVKVTLPSRSVTVVVGSLLSKLVTLLKVGVDNTGAQKGDGNLVGGRVSNISVGISWD
jgi:hypothetical protein